MCRIKLIESVYSGNVVYLSAMLKEYVERLHDCLFNASGLL